MKTIIIFLAFLIAGCCETKDDFYELAKQVYIEKTMLNTYYCYFYAQLAFRGKKLTDKQKIHHGTRFVNLMLDNMRLYLEEKQ